MPLGKIWGLHHQLLRPEDTGGAFKEVHPIQGWTELDQLVVPNHQVDEERTQAGLEMLHDAVGDLIDIDLDQGTLLRRHGASIAEPLCMMRGIEPVMLDMYEHPDELHQLAATLRDGPLLNHQEAEEAGDWSPTTQCNQAEVYCEELEDPAPTRTVKNAVSFTATARRRNSRSFRPKCMMSSCCSTRC